MIKSMGVSVLAAGAIALGLSVAAQAAPSGGAVLGELKSQTQQAARQGQPEVQQAHSRRHYWRYHRHHHHHHHHHHHRHHRHG